MKSRMLVSLLVIALAAAVIGGATMAWFTDSAGSEDVTFTAGTLDITVSGEGVDFDGDTIYLHFDEIAKNMAPGDTTGVVNINVKNTGSLDIGLFRKFSVEGNLADALKVYNLTVSDWSGEYKMVEDGVKNMDSAPDNLFELCNWPDQVEAAGAGGWFGIALGTDASNNFYNTQLEFQFDKAAGNEYQGQEAVLMIEFKATQKNAEAIKDSLGSSYPWADLIAGENLETLAN